MHCIEQNIKQDLNSDSQTTPQAEYSCFSNSCGIMTFIKYCDNECHGIEYHDNECHDKMNTTNSNIIWYTNIVLCPYLLKHTEQDIIKCLDKCNLTKFIKIYKKIAEIPISELHCKKAIASKLKFTNMCELNTNVLNTNVLNTNVLIISNISCKILNED